MPTSLPPDSITPPFSGGWNNTPPSSVVLPGEQSPVAGITAPSVTVVSHTATLAAGTNYLVKVGTRAAPVTINLPDPGSDGQAIEISDASRQAAQYPITISGGSKIIEQGSPLHSLQVNGSALRVAFMGSIWKIL